MFAPASAPFTGYHWRLFVFLSVACFFEGYDFMALTQVLTEIRDEMGLDAWDSGVAAGFINAGTIAAWALIRAADRWGRRRMLTITIAGYTTATFISGLAPEIVSFSIAQFFARVFLISEWAISMVYAAEAFPEHRRGTVIGIIQGFASLGAIVCVGVVPLLKHAPWGWRTVYFVGIVPLLLLAFARRNLKETDKFLEASRQPALRRSVFAVWTQGHAGRLVKLGVIWSLTYACNQTAVTFWRDFAIRERSFSEGDVSIALGLAAVVSMPLVFVSGWLIDGVGRRVGAAIIFTAAAGGTALAYTLYEPWALIASLTLGVFGISATLSVLNTYTTELFPTLSRADCFAWCNNALGRVGYVVSPVVVGYLASQTSWGAAVPLTAVCPLVAVLLIFLWLPETRGQTLEETASAEAGKARAGRAPAG
jgi:putative MFS transporter